MDTKGSTAILLSILMISSIFVLLIDPPDNVMSERSFDPPPSRFAGGYGTVNYPFQITNATELQEMRWFPDDHFIIMNDIDATETKDWNGGEGFYPVALNVQITLGGFTGQFFNGTLNGNDKTISNLVINRSYDNYLGLFGYIGLVGKVYDLTLSQVDFGHRGVHIGGIAAINEGSIINCKVDGNLDGHIRVGGLAGINLGFIQRCSSNVYIDATGDVGGFAGHNEGTIYECNSTSSVMSRGYWTGGFVGRNFGSIEDCYYNGAVTGGQEDGAFIGGDEGDVLNSFYCINYTTLNGVKPHSPFGIYKEHYDEWIDNGLSLDTNNYLDKVPKTNLYSISSVDDIWNMVPFTYGNIKFKQMRDIDLSSLDEFIIPGFYSHEYDGNGHTISNVSVFSPEMDKLGLFGIVSKDSRIFDLNLFNISITGGQYIGGLAGVVHGTITNCNVWSSPTGTKDVGGLAGSVKNGYVLRCSSSGYISGTENLGGLLGSCYEGRIWDCSSDVQVTAIGHNIGGLIGYLWPIDWQDTINVVLRCSASGSVSGVDNVGGLIGQGYGNISMTHATGTVNGDDYVGGLVGRYEGGWLTFSYATGSVTALDHYSGGLIGRNNGGIIRNSFATGDVDGYKTSGGLIGSVYHGSVENSTAHGDVIGWETVGGLIGRNSNADIYNSYATGSVEGTTVIGGLAGGSDVGTIKNCYSIGMVTATERFGGLVGYSNMNDHVVVNSFWDKTTSGQTTSTGGIGKTTAQLKQFSTFGGAAWDFTEDWGIQDGVTTPFLQNLDYSSMISTENVLMAYEEFQYEVDYDVTPPFEGLPTEYKWGLETNAGDWLSVNENGILSGTPRSGDAGKYTVNVTLSFGNILFTYTEFELSVMNVLDTLEITTSPEKYGVEDVEYRVLYKAIDKGPVPRTLEWDLQTNASFLTIFPINGLLIGTPENEDVGSFWVNVSISDGTGRKAWDNFTLHVENVNDVPIIVPDELPPAYEDTPYWVIVEGMDVDPTDDVLTWSMVTDANFLDLDPSSGNLSTTTMEQDSGEYWVNFTIDDGIGGNSSKNLTFLVIGVNDPPNLNITSFTYEGWEDSELVIPLYDIFHDAENDILQFSHNYSGELVVVISNGITRIVPHRNWNGQDNITFSAHDGKAGTSVELTVIFNGINDAPHDVTLISKTRFVNEYPQLFECTAADDDIVYGDSLHYLWTSNISGTIGDNKTIWANLSEGFHLVTLTVSDDGGLSSNATIEVEIIIDDFVASKKEEDNGWLVILIAIVAAALVIALAIVVFFLFMKRKGEKEKEKELEQVEDEDYKVDIYEKELQMFEELTHHNEGSPIQPVQIAQEPMPLLPQQGIYPGHSQLPSQPMPQNLPPQQQMVGYPQYAPQPAQPIQGGYPRYAPPPARPIEQYPVQGQMMDQSMYQENEYIAPTENEIPQEDQQEPQYIAPPETKPGSTTSEDQQLS
jgi:Big-like domain-containing protein/GLUG motif-containing protein/putative Ig domain-containing protein